MVVLSVAINAQVIIFGEVYFEFVTLVLREVQTSLES